jgi:hypothetical protein
MSLTRPQPLIPRVVQHLPGAEAVLLLRAVIMNADFEAYWRFHLEQEHQRTHTSRYHHRYDLAA